MNRGWKSMLAIVTLTGLLVSSGAATSSAQVRRYQPTQPTISPYLNLFQQDRRNPFLPNYFSFVRPLQQQLQVNKQQQYQLQEQNLTIGQLQYDLQNVERGAEGPLVAPTGKGSWFFRPSTRSQFLNTSRYYSQSGNIRR